MTAAKRSDPKKLTEYQTPLMETLRQRRVWLSGSVILHFGRCGRDCGDLGVHAARGVARDRAGGGGDLGRRVLGDVYGGAGRGGAVCEASGRRIGW